MGVWKEDSKGYCEAGEGQWTSHVGVDREARSYNRTRG
jgi:hypothetical protein